MKQLHIFTIFATPHSFFDGQFRYLADEGNDIILVSSKAYGTDEFARRNHIRFVPVEMPRALSLGAIWCAIKQIRAIIKRENPDVVFGHTPVGALCAMIAARWCGVKNRVYYRHGLIYTTMTGVKRLIFKMEEQFVSALATDIVNVSHSLSRLAVKDNLNSDKKQHVIGHGTCGGIDAINIFNPNLIEEEKREKIASQFGLCYKNGTQSRRVEGDSFLNTNHTDYTNTPSCQGKTSVDSASLRENDSIVFGFCGRICNDKGIPELVDAFELFQKSHSEINAKLLFIGGLDSRDGVSKTKEEQIKANKDIIVTGHIEKADIPYYYSLLDVFVFPSHREGFGMVAIEASAMEKPLLVSKVHGCEDTIVEHITGEYIDLSTEGICKGMEMMLDADKRKFLGKNGRKNVLEWYDFRGMWPLVSKLYREILK